MPPRGVPPRHGYPGNGRQALDNLVNDTLRRVALGPLASQIAQSNHTPPMPGSASVSGSREPKSNLPRPRPRVEDFLDVIMRREGGLVDNPKDPGKRTNFGITQSTLLGWLHNEASTKRDSQGVLKEEPKRLPGVPGIPERVDDLTIEQARALHKDRAWTKYDLDRVHDNNVAFHLFDMLTHTSPRGVSRIAYPAIDEVMRKNRLYDEGLDPLVAPKDHGIDAAAIDRINMIEQRGLIRELQEALVNQRLAYVKTLPSYRYFRNGWTRRIEEFRPRSTPPEGWYE